ncbi:nuclease-related domain-containing protein [Metasolibacillus sp.]|uniref:nuclease-related domain-containing protein n=1 Tax=Metasolibacillus sp. TaxID=2703680 RepID=UPI0025E0BDFD|nr:nuclease-related domain-containing protein [Metasolibacillus sp.]MCT6923826.1 NERD domain-containing protein [Metasolibacillus sp.]MCT6939941.1 NERD domain-containing protein [Metasolibacillus sp.]
MVWILLGIFLLIVIVMLVIYKYDDSLFSKATSYSIFDVLSSSRIRTLYTLTNELKATKEKYDILFDVQLQSDEAPVDALIMHTSGIYIIRVEQKKGWIAGREQDLEWSQLLYKDRKEAFPNPIHQVQRSIYALRDLLPNIDVEAYKTLVVFTNECSFQKIELHSDKIDVLKAKDLKGWITDLRGQKDQLSTENVQAIYDALKDRKDAVHLTTKTA